VNFETSRKRFPVFLLHGIKEKELSVPDKEWGKTNFYVDFIVSVSFFLYNLNVAGAGCIASSAEIAVKKVAE